MKVAEALELHDSCTAGSAASAHLVALTACSAGVLLTCGPSECLRKCGACGQDCVQRECC